MLFKTFASDKVFLGILITLLSIVIPSILEVLNHIIFRKENIKKQRRFTKSIDGLIASFYRAVIGIAVLPTKAYISLDAMVKTIYRMTVSKQHLLEWTTSDEAERKDKNRLLDVCKTMAPNIFMGLAFLCIISFVKCSIYFKVFVGILSVLFIIAPFIMWYISKEKSESKRIDRLSKDEQAYIRNVAEKTWKYFEDYMNSENSFLPPDNFQENRREKIINRTSSTNIGLGLLAIISAYDLKFITLEKTIINLENVFDTIEKLEKWNGHLYNWYNIRTLKPLTPRYISSVDSGNFVRIFVYCKNVFRGETKYTI